MGLARVREVAQRLALQLTCPCIVVAGTNGKGSTCAMLESVLRPAGDLLRSVPAGHAGRIRHVDRGRPVDTRQGLRGDRVAAIGSNAAAAPAVDLPGTDDPTRVAADSVAAGAAPAAQCGGRDCSA